MNKKLGRLLKPNMGAYFGVLALFVAAAVLMRYYLLAAGEAVAALLVFVIYLYSRKYRRKELHSYIRGAVSLTELTDHAESPFPSVVLRLKDGGIVFVNDSFAKAAVRHVFSCFIILLLKMASADRHR
jgi:hypothetical protein